MNNTKEVHKLYRSGVSSWNARTVCGLLPWAMPRGAFVTSVWDDATCKTCLDHRPPRGSLAAKAEGRRKDLR